MTTTETDRQQGGSSELKNCPFCGGVPTIRSVGWQHGVYCTTCGSAHPPHDHKRGAVEAWNQRYRRASSAEHQVQDLKDEVERLKRHIHLHAGDCMSLSNDLEIAREAQQGEFERANSAEAERDTLQSLLSTCVGALARSGDFIANGPHDAAEADAVLACVNAALESARKHIGDPAFPDMGEGR